MTARLRRLQMDRTDFQNPGFQGSTPKRLRGSRLSCGRRVAKALVLITLVLLTGCREQILHNLSEIDVTRIASRLESQGIAAERERQPDGRWTILVNREDSSRAVQLIESHRLLREDRGPQDAKSSMLASREDQRFHYERSLSRELESTLGTLDGVLEARVHLNLPPLDPIFGQPLAQTKGSASVLVIVGSGFVAQSAEIAGMISGASGISVDGISVLISRSKDPVYQPDLEVSAAAAQDVASTKVPDPKAVAVTGVRSEASTLRAESIMEIAIAFFILGVGLVCLSRSRRLRPRRGHSLSPEIPSETGAKYAA
ncbi:MAG: hypothetical protein EBZ48_06520 [Proteobacteria bacterium]|nr:hypothetical protein [Pseudomonadota bacterium]